MTQVSKRLFGFWCAWLCTVAIAIPVRGQELRDLARGEAETSADLAAQQQEQNASTIRFRRVFVPESRLPELSRAAYPGPYIPVARDHFDRAVEQSQRQQPGAVSLAQADYEAVFDGHNLVDGRVAYRVVVHQSPAVWPMDLDGWAIRDMRWKDTREQPMVWDLTSKGPWLVTVPASGTLLATWSSQGRKLPGGEVAFDLQLPVCPVNRIKLHLSPDYRLHSDVGMVESRELDVPLPEPWNGSEQVPGTQFRIWTVHLGGWHRVRMMISPNRPGAVATPPLRVQTAESHVVSLAGIATDASFVFDRSQPLPQRIAIALDPNVRITRVLWQDQPLRWDRTRDPVTGQLIVLVDCRSVPAEGDQVIHVRSESPVTLGTGLRLPTFRLPNASWESGRVRVTLSPAVELADVRLDGCYCLAGETVPANHLDRVYDFRVIEPSAWIEVVLQSAATRYGVTGVTMVSVDTNAATATTALQLSSANADVFTFEAQLSDLWQVQSVTASSADSIEDWLVVGREPHRKLQVRFRDPLAVGNNLDLVVRTHRGFDASAGWIDPRQLVPLSPVAHGSEIEYLAVAAQPPYRLQFVGGRAARFLRSDELPEPVRSLLNTSQVDFVAAINEQLADLRIRLIEGPTAFDCQAGVHLEFEEDRITERYRLDVRPQRGSLRQLHVWCASAREREVRWSLKDHTDESLAATRQQTDDPVVGERWTIELPQPMTEPFVLEGVRQIPAKWPLSASLVSVPGATSQSGQLTIWVTRAGMDLEVHRHAALQSLPTGTETSSRGLWPQSVFVYEPERDAYSQTPLLTIAPAPRAAPRSRVLVSLVTSDVRIDPRNPDQPLYGVATYHVYNQGSSELHWHVPEACQIQRVAMDGRQQLLPKIGVDRKLTLRLPDAPRSEVQIVYTVQNKPVRWSGVLHPGSPTVESPVLKRRHTLWLPPDFACAGLARMRPDSTAAWGTENVSTSQQAPLPATIASLPGEKTQSPQLRSLAVSAAGTGASDIAMLQNAGWNRYRYPQGQRPDGVWVYRVSSFWILSGLAFLAGLFVTSVLPPRCRRVAGPATLAIMLVALWSEPPWQWVALALLCGAAVEGVLAWLRRREQTRRTSVLPASARSSNSSPASAVGPALALMFLIATYSSAQATPDEPARSDNAEAASPIYSVFIPTDAQGQAADQYVHVPDALYRHLFPHREPAGLIHGVTYRAQTAVDGLPGGVLTMELELQLAAPVDPVRLNLPALLLGRIQKIRVNDRPTTFRIDLDTASVVLPRLERGHQRVDISVAVDCQFDRDQRRVELPIPPFPFAQLIVALGPFVSDVRVPTAAGVSRAGSVPGTVHVDLGPTPDLVVQWTANEAVRSAVPSIRQLWWLELRGSSIILHLKLLPIGAVASAAPLPLTLVADPRMKVLPQSKDAGLLVPVQDASYQSAWQVPWSADSGQSRSVQLDFLLTDVSPAGYVYAPLFQIQGARTDSTWLGVQSDESLNDRLQLPSDVAVVSAREFQDEWAAPGPGITSAYRTDDSSIAWRLALRPQTQTQQVQATSTYVLGRSQLEVRYSASLNPSGADFYQKVIVPPSMTIQQVVLVTADEQQPLPVQRVDAGVVTVVFPRPIAEPYQLEVRGWYSVTGESFVLPPPLQLQGTRARETRIEVYRTSEVLAQITPAPAGGERRDDSARNWRNRWRLLDWTTADSFPEGTTLKIQPNPTPESAGLAFRLWNQQGSWYGEARCVLEEYEGLIDELYFDISPSWTGDLKVDPPAMITVGNSPAAGSRRVHVWFREPLDRSTVVRLHGPVTPEADQPLVVPRVALVSPPTTTSWLFLPAQLHRDRLVWSTTGLEPSGLSAAGALKGLAGQSDYVYRVIAEPYRAVLSLRADPQSEVSVERADILVHVPNRGPLFCLAVLDMEAPGRESCLVEGPRALELVHAQLCGQSIQFRRLREGRWQLTLPGHRLPFRLVLAFQQQGDDASDASSPWFLEAPRLLFASEGKVRPCTVKQSLCTLAGSAVARRIQLPARVLRASAAGLEEQRMVSYQALLDRADPGLSASAAEVYQAFLRRWRQRIEAAERRAGREQPVLPKESGQPNTASSGDESSDARSRHESAGASPDRQSAAVRAEEARAAPVMVAPAAVETAPPKTPELPTPGTGATTTTPTDEMAAAATDEIDLFYSLLDDSDQRLYLTSGQPLAIVVKPTTAPARFPWWRVAGTLVTLGCFIAWRLRSFAGQRSRPSDDSGAVPLPAANQGSS